MLCKHCNQEVDRNMKYCPYCGEEINNDHSSFFIALICFICPIIGLILYFMLYKEYPLKARSAAKGAIISVVLNIIITLLLYIIYIIAFASLFF